MGTSTFDKAPIFIFQSKDLAIARISGDPMPSNSSMLHKLSAAGILTDFPSGLRDGNRFKNGILQSQASTI
jgi:hypothetical protein